MSSVADEPKGRCGPGRGAGGQKPDDKARRQLPERESGEAPRRPAKRCLAGSAAARAGERRLLEQRLEGGGQRRAGLPQLVVTLAQALVRRQTRQESASRAFIELVVDQRDKFGVVVGSWSNRVLAQRSYFSFASAARPAASLLMIGADRDAERRRRLGVAVTFAVHQQDRLALRLRQAANRS